MAKITGIHSSGAPVGTILPCGNATALPGTLLCQGQAVSRTTYAALFAAIGTAYGVGDGSTTFNLPNTQGYFLRGAGTTGGYSTTRGAVQGDAFGSHQHVASQGTTSFLSPGGSAKPDAQNWTGTGTQWLTSNAGSSETRPANVGVNYCIAY